jgi:hypothetical protein
MAIVRSAIIGCGNVTEVKSGPGFQKTDGSSLVAVMRRHRANAEDYARRHGVPRAHETASALILDSEVDEAIEGGHRIDSWPAAPGSPVNERAIGDAERARGPSGEGVGPVEARKPGEVAVGLLVAATSAARKYMPTNLDR